MSHNCNLHCSSALSHRYLDDSCERASERANEDRLKREEERTNGHLILANAGRDVGVNLERVSLNLKRY